MNDISLFHISFHFETCLVKYTFSICTCNFVNCVCGKRLFPSRLDQTVHMYYFRSRYELALTKDDEQTAKDGGQCSQSQFHGLRLVHQLAVVSPEVVRTDAAVAGRGLLVDAHSAVLTRPVKTLITVHTQLAVHREAPALSTSVSIWNMIYFTLLLKSK